tara:strand:- start:1805 stop:2026 length:222 start_codon:yes stop_codon:yes gene_type:complete
MTQYIIHDCINGRTVVPINSVMIFAKKYELTRYIPPLTSLKKTGLSEGKICEILDSAEKPLFKVMKKRAPFLS